MAVRSGDRLHLRTPVTPHGLRWRIRVLLGHVRAAEVVQDGLPNLGAVVGAGIVAHSAVPKDDCNAAWCEEHSLVRKTRWQAVAFTGACGAVRIDRLGLAHTMESCLVLVAPQLLIPLAVPPPLRPALRVLELDVGKNARCDLSQTMRAPLFGSTSSM